MKEKRVTHEILYSLIAIYLLSYVHQVFFYLRFMLKTASYQEPDLPAASKPVSVIICAHNEADNLKHYLPAVLNQNYPNFQVVVVNDCSTDDTEMVLAQLKKEHKHLYYTSIPTDKKFIHGKKLAITLGIKAAQHNQLIFTDADCEPASDKWLQEMANRFSSEKEIVVGHGRYYSRKSLLNLFIRYETFWNAVQYFGFTLIGRPFMAVGRNMAYKKELFEKSDVFRQHLMLASGDDDLLINACSTKQNTAIALHPDAQTYTEAPRSFSDWFNRKSRHLTTSPHYPAGIKWWLISEPATRQLFWLLTLCSLFFHTFALYSVMLFASRMILQYIILAKAARRMGEGKLYIATFLFDLITPMLVGTVWLVNVFSPNKTKWK